MLIQREINLTTDNGWTAEDLAAEFDASWEDADPSVGECGGWSCEFVSTKIGGLAVDRDMLVRIFDRTAVVDLETRAAESLREYHGYADLEAA